MSKIIDLYDKTNGCAIFDFDGTLIDSYTNRYKSHVKVCEVFLNYLNELGCEINKTKIIDIILKVEIEMTEKRNYDKEKWWQKVLYLYTGKSIKENKINDKASLAYWNTVDENSIIYPGTIKMLQTLKKNNILLGLLSDTDGYNGMKLKRIKNSGLSEYFESIVVSGEDTVEVKPHKQPFLKISKLIGIEPEKCIYIGDNPNADITGAKEIGMKTILIKSSYFQNSKTIIPDFILQRGNFTEIYKLIIDLLCAKN